MSPDERKELNGVVVVCAAACVVIAALVTFMPRCEHQPTQVLPAPGEHSLLVEREVK